MRPNWIADASMINDFRKCPEFARLRHHLGLVRPGYEEMTGSGTAWHAAMEAWFDKNDDDGGYVSFDFALDVLREAWGDEPAPMFEGEAPFRKRPLELFERMLAIYCEKYPREDDPFEVVGNEEYVAYCLGDDLAYDPESPPPYHLTFDYCGIRDRKIHFPDDSEYVVDTKSTSANLNRSYFDAFELSQAMIGYCALELVHGRRCDGFMIDAAHVGQYFQKMTKTKGLQTYGGDVKPEDFVRYGPIRVAQWQLSRWAKDTEVAIRQIEQCVAQYGDGEPWERREQGCFRWNKPCEYWNRPGTGLPGICRCPEEMHPQLMAEYETSFWDPRERGN